MRDLPCILLKSWLVPLSPDAMKSERIYYAVALALFMTPALAWRGSSSGSASGAIALLMLFVGGGIGKVLWGNGGVLVGAAVGFVLAILFHQWIAGILVAGIAYWLLSSLYKDWREEREKKAKD
jgi:hypothetical protein